MDFCGKSKGNKKRRESTRKGAFFCGFIFEFSKGRGYPCAPSRAKAPVGEYQHSPPLGSASAKRNPSPYFLRTKSNKKPGNPSSRFPDPPWRSKGNDVPLRYPLPTSPFGQYKAAPSGKIMLFSEDFDRHQINLPTRHPTFLQNHSIVR